MNPRASLSRGLRGETVMAGLLGIFIAALSAAPLARLLLEAVAPGGRFGFATMSAVLADRQSWIAAAHTIESGLAAMAIALAIGAPAALLVALTDIRGKAALVFAFMLPLLIPPQIVAAAWIELLGPSSPLLSPIGLAPRPGAPHPLYGAGGVALLLGIEQAPIVFLALNAGLRAVPRELVEAAQASGAGAWRILRTVILPLVAAPLTAGAALAFVAAIGNFGTPALLGIPGGYSLLTTLIYQKLAGFGPRILGEVADLSVLLALIAAAGLAAQARIGRRGHAVGSGAAAPPLPWALGARRPLVEALCWAVLAAIVAMPLGALVATSLLPAYGVPLTPASLTLDNYRYVVLAHDGAARAARNSIVLAGSAAFILAALALPLGQLLTRRRSAVLRRLALLAELPYALPGIVLAIGLILVLIRPLPLVGSLYNTIWIILLAYLARFLALALRPIAAAYRQLDPALDEAARMSGAGFLRRLGTITLPLLAPAVAAGALLVFLTALNELTLSILLWSSGNETLGIVVFSLEQGGDGLSAAALAVLAVIATILLMLLAGLAGRRLPRGAVPWQA